MVILERGTKLYNYLFVLWRCLPGSQGKVDTKLQNTYGSLSLHWNIWGVGYYWPILATLLTADQFSLIGFFVKQEFEFTKVSEDPSRVAEVARGHGGPCRKVWT